MAKKSTTKTNKPKPAYNGKHPGGRPPIHGTGEELIKLGKEMMQWMEEHKDDEKFVHLSDWYLGQKDMSRSQWAIIIQRSEFQEYYEKAMDFMASKTLRNERLSTAYGSRYLGMYCKNLRTHEKEVKFEGLKYEAELKAEIANKPQSSPNDNALDQLIQSLKALK